MWLPGYCGGCHRVGRVRVSAAGLARAQLAGNGVFIGICHDCMEKERA